EEDIKQGTNPRDLKLRLAKEIVSLYHGKEAGEAAEHAFIETFSQGKVPENIQTIHTEAGKMLVDVIVSVGAATSKTDARRKIEQGGVEINGKKVELWSQLIETEHDGAVVKVGKKDFFRIAF
ncbi:MAG: S4 domain-containing protein, partial [Candidatus Moraniibacteriota bacterium]